MEAENIIWLRNNVNILIDENISRHAGEKVLGRQDVKENLIKKGYKNVFDVYSLNYQGANDGKILKLLKEKKMILLTFDRHFHKMISRYNNDLCCQIIHGSFLGARTITNRFELWMQKNYKKIKEYMK